MFNFFKKESDVLHLDAYTTDPVAYEYTPLVKTNKTIPQWWKDLPVVPGKDENGLPIRKGHNMKTCTGFIDLYKYGLVLEYWNDLVITVDPKKGLGLQYGYEQSKKDSPHPQYQWGKGFPNHYHLKLNSPWFIKEKTGADFLFCPAMWSRDQIETPKIMTGVIAFKYQLQINVNMFFPIRSKSYKVKLTRGTPLIQIIPLCQKKINLESHLITQQEDSILQRPYTPELAGNYPVKKRMFQRVEEREAEEKCPFNWFNRS
mgnify:CR=1 FL=1